MQCVPMFVSIGIYPSDVLKQHLLREKTCIARMPKSFFLRFLVHSIVFFYTFALPKLAVLPLFLNLAF